MKVVNIKTRIKKIQFIQDNIYLSLKTRALNYYVINIICKFRLDGQNIIISFSF
jgi:hypothetical protein